MTAAGFRYTATDLQKAIGRVVRTNREEMGLSVSRCALGCGMSTTSWKDVENGAPCVSVRVLEKVCLAFGCSLSGLIADAEEELEVGPGDPAVHPAVSSLGLARGEASNGI